MTKKLWGGGFSESANADLEDFWSSISFDYVLADLDIEGSLAHAAMLAQTGIISKEDGETIRNGLLAILDDVKAGKIEFKKSDEDVHMNIERILHERIGAVAGKLHTARSRNDQTALDMHLYVRRACHEEIAALKEIIAALMKQAAQYPDAIMPGYTHLQRAQPVLYAHHLLAYAWMFTRDIERLKLCLEHVSLSPLGAGAIAGTTFPIDRELAANALGFKGIYHNSMDAVSNRDHFVELHAANALIAAHLSRFCEEIILWVSSEFGFVKLSDAYCTGSSMMPQKKNADLAELVRGKTGRVYGHLMAILTIIKGTPLTYNKDFQEDKEGLFDSVHTIKNSLIHLTGMIETMTPRPDNMLKATNEGFLNATDAADYLTAKGLPFREAHEVIAKLVADCYANGKTLGEVTLEEYQALCPLFEDDIFATIDIANVVARRTSAGGTSPQSVAAQTEALTRHLGTL